MSEHEPLKQKNPSNAQVLIFVATLSLICALILSILASALKEPQEEAKELDRSIQMMIAAKIMNHTGNFLLLNDKGEYILAKYAKNGTLVFGNENDLASRKDILDIYKKRLIPFLIDEKGDATTFQKAGINLETYMNDFRKIGYYRQPFKLLYKILPNPQEGEHLTEETPIGYVIPVNGFGLWGPIYGYLAIKPDGNTVIGISWYDQIETPGLGANIAEKPWQDNFVGKKIFQEGAENKTDFKTTPIGITVVKGKVSEVLGDSPKAKSAVDGMAGATLTGTGVTTAYREVLSAYRPFFIKLHDNNFKNKGASDE